MIHVRDEQYADRILMKYIETLRTVRNFNLPQKMRDEKTAHETAFHILKGVSTHQINPHLQPGQKIVFTLNDAFDHSYKYVIYLQEEK